MKIKNKTILTILTFSIYFSNNVNAQTQTKITSDNANTENKFGNSVSIDGDYAIVGEYLADENGIDSGSAYVYFYNGTNWVLQSELVPNDPQSNDFFGYDVSIDGDYAVVGAYGADQAPNADVGSVYVFNRSGTIWTQQAKLSANDASAADSFGWSVDIDGEYIVVGSYQDDDVASNSGSAYVFNRTGSTWNQQAKLIADFPEANDNFGYDVSISDDTVVIGANQDDEESNSDAGSAYVFVRNGTSWSQQAKLNANDASASDFFGESVDIDGNSIVVGAYLEDNGVLFSGSAYVFVRSGTIWSQQAKLNALDADVVDEFGRSVSIKGDSIIIGVNQDDDDGNASGSAYLFTRSGTSWTQQMKFTSNDASAGDRFGFSVSNDGKNVIIGAPFNDDDGSNSGSTYIYSFDDAPLSVEINSFTAHQIENSISLTWVTGSETENEGFNVYRQTGKGNFTQIASYKGNSELLGALNSTVSNDYTFVDESELRNGETYTYYISDVESNGVETKHEEVAQSVKFVLNDEETQTKLDYVLEQNYPNPFNPNTTINYELKSRNSDLGKLTIFNSNGEFVKEFELTESKGSIVWNGTDESGKSVSSGTYFYKLTAGTFTQTNKMILLK